MTWRPSRKMDRSAREDRERAVGTALELAWASEDPEVEDGAQTPTHDFSKAPLGAAHWPSKEPMEPTPDVESQLPGNVRVEETEKATGQFRKVLAARGEIWRNVS